MEEEEEGDNMELLVIGRDDDGDDNIIVLFMLTGGGSQGEGRRFRLVTGKIVDGRRDRFYDLIRERGRRGWVRLSL